METLKVQEYHDKAITGGSAIAEAGPNESKIPNFKRYITEGQASISDSFSRPETPKHPKKEREEGSTKYRALNATILLQPEIQIMKLEKEREQEKLKYAMKTEDMPNIYTKDQMSLLSRFPWMADQIKSAITNLREGNAVTGMGRLKSALSKKEQTRSDHILKKRKDHLPLLRRDSDQVSEETKVVFDRNIPMLIYNRKSKHCIKVGGDRDISQGNLEAIYRAINFNPELKKVTLDLDDLLHPEKEKTNRLSVNYMSANTLHNPYVITDDMCRFSHKKELMIKIIIEEIERRLLFQRDGREQRAEKQQKQEEEIRKQKEEEEQRGWDYIVSKRLLSVSKQIDQKLLTEQERKQERHRRIRLRTKSIPVRERSDNMVRQRKIDVQSLKKTF